jgi:hypothetical protein
MTAMKIVTLAAAVLFGLAALAPVRADDCDTVMERADDAMTVASLAYALHVEELSKKKPETDAERAVFLKKLCSHGGEIFGIQKAVRALSAECLKGGDRRKKLGTLDESLKKLEATLKETCG